MQFTVFYSTVSCIFFSSFCYFNVSIILFFFILFYALIFLCKNEDYYEKNV